MMNYNKMSQKQNNETQELLEKIDELIPQPVQIEEPETLEGVVSGCTQMYVRSEASIGSEPLGVIKSGTKVQIDETNSTIDFYSVCTETGLEGFCMKKFISIL